MLNLVIASILYVPLVFVTAAAATTGLQNTFELPWLVAYLIGINLVAFGFYVWDKWMARFRAFLHLEFLPIRVPTYVLIWMLAFPGGAAGAILAMFLTSHKIGPAEMDFRLRLLRVIGLELALGILLVVLTLVVGPQILETLGQVVEAVCETVLGIANTILTTILT